MTEPTEWEPYEEITPTYNDAWSGNPDTDKYWRK